MALAIVSRRPLRPRFEFSLGRSTFRFFHGDSLAVLQNWNLRASAWWSRPRPITWASSTAATATTCRAANTWPGQIGGCARSPGCSRRQGSLFMNVGAKPTDPWIRARGRAGRAQASEAAEHDSLGQVDRHRSRGDRSRQPARPRRGRRSLQADQQRSVRQRLPRVHLSFLAGRPEPARSPRRRRALSGPVEHQALGRGRRRPALPRQHVVHSVRDDPEPRPRSAAPGVISAEGSGAVRASAWPRTRRRDARSVPGTGQRARSPPRGSAWTSSGSKWTSTT